MEGMAKLLLIGMRGLGKEKGAVTVFKKTGSEHILHIASQEKRLTELEKDY